MIEARSRLVGALKKHKVFRLDSWLKVFRRQRDSIKGEFLRKKVETIYVRLGALSQSDGLKTLVADGLWDNPNHFFRLRLFLEALPDIQQYRLLGVIRTSGDRTRKTLESFGFRDFLCIEEHKFDAKDYLLTAKKLLEGIKSHSEILNLKLPLGLPAYTYYDTVLKAAQDPQPPLNCPLWVDRLAETLRDLDIYEELLVNYDVKKMVLSHPWKIEFATLMWSALKREIDSYHLTGFCEGVRVRLLRDITDYNVPVEHFAYKEYKALTSNVQDRLRDEGAKYLNKRQTGDVSDINTRFGFQPKFRTDTRTKSRDYLGAKPGRPLVIIYSHAWFDFPHTYGMTNFTDFLDWISFTVDQIRNIEAVDWLLKPHPLEPWYGGAKLSDIVRDLPSHIHISPTVTDSQTSIVAADAIVTVHGTVALEAVAQGVCVIAADQSYYSDWGFTHVAKSREHYASLLASVVKLAKPTPQQKNDALACLALSLAPASGAMKSLSLLCDSSGVDLYKDILDMFRMRFREVDAERQALSLWLKRGSRSYAADSKVRYFTDLIESAGDKI